MEKNLLEQLDAKRLRHAVLEAVKSLSTDRSERDGLVEYLSEQAREKPTAFLSLLLKIIEKEDDREELDKVTKIEIIAKTSDKSELDGKIKRKRGRRTSDTKS